MKLLATPSKARARRSAWATGFCVLVAASSLVACKKSDSKAQPASSTDQADAGPSTAVVQQSLEGLKTALSTLNAKFAGLRKQVEAIPPETPGFADVRAKFYATDEGLGITGAKVSWLSKRLEAAAHAGKATELQQVSNDIAHTYEEIQQIDRIGLVLLHQLLPFEDAASDAAPTKKL